MNSFIPITDVCVFEGGTQPPKSEWSRTKKEGYIRMLQIRDFTQPDKDNIEYIRETINIKKCNTDDILIGRYGASIGKILTGLSGAYNVAIVKTVPDTDRLCKPFLKYLLEGISFQSFIKNVGARAAQAGFNKKELEGFNIPLPPLETQKKIAAILDKANELRQNDKKILEKYDQLAQSVFLEMFGDPVRNEKGFEFCTIRDLVDEVKYGTSAKASETGKYPYLRMNNITYSGYLDLSAMKYINVLDKELLKYNVKKGDLLFNRTNSKELVGKTGVYNNDQEMIIAGYLIRVRVNSYANPYYLWGYLNSRHGKMTLKNMCKNIVGMANINAQELQEIRILKAPLELQSKFAEIISKIEEQKSVTEKSLLKSEELFQSLLQRAFKGELI